MWLAFQGMQTWYDFSCLYWHEKDWGHWDDDWWGLEFQTNGSFFTVGCWEYYAYNYNHFYSCGFPTCFPFPDTDGWAQPAIRALANGDIWCEYWDDYRDPYPGFHNHYYCQYF